MGQQLGGDAGAVVRNADDGVRAARARPDANHAAWVRVLHGVREDVAHALDEPRHVAFDEQRFVARRRFDRQRMTFFAQPRLYGSDALRHHAREIDRAALQRNAPLRDARDIEQVVDETGQLRGLTLDHVDGRLRARMAGEHARQQFARVGDRRKRIVQFVREHREKLVLLAVGAARRLDAVRAFVGFLLARNDDGRRLREAHRQFAVARRRLAHLLAIERERADDLAARRLDRKRPAGAIAIRLREPPSPSSAGRSERRA